MSCNNGVFSLICTDSSCFLMVKVENVSLFFREYVFAKDFKIHLLKTCAL